MLVLMALSAILSAVGVGLFIRRDVGAHLALAIGPRRPAHQMRRPALPWQAWSLRSIVARSIASVTPSAAWWGLGLALYTDRGGHAGAAAAPAPATDFRPWLIREAA